MNKKAFTLIEIIISIIMISVIVLITFVAIKNKDDNATDEIYNLVVDSAAVKYTSNSKELEEIENNYGYKVYNIIDLINSGYIDDNRFNKLLTKLKENGVTGDYSKILLIYNYSENGEINYIYPYQKNVNEFLVNNFDDTIFIKDSINNSFNCLEGINTSNIYYLNKDYEKTLFEGNVSDNLFCKIVDININSNDKDIGGFTDKVDFTNSGKYYLQYVLKDGEKELYTLSEREVFVIDVSSLGIKVSGTKKDNSSDWYTSDVNVSINGIENVDLTEYGMSTNYIWNADELFENNNTILNFLPNKSTLGSNVSLNIKIKNNSNTELINKNFSVNGIKVDSEEPQIIFENIDDSKVKFKVKDEYSGIKSVGIYKNNDLVKVLEAINGSYEFNLLENRDCYIKVLDNAGNEATNDFKNLPSVSVKAVDDSVFNFKVNVGNVKKVDINFDLPDVEKEINLKVFNSSIAIDEEAEVIDNIIQPINKSYDFSFLTFQNKIYNSFPWEISERIFDNLRVGCNIKVVTLDDQEINYRYIVKLNAYAASNYFGSKLFKVNSWNSWIEGFNNNGDIVFIQNNYPSERVDKYTIFVTKIGGITKELMNVNYEADNYYELMSFDEDYLKYGKYKLSGKYCYNYFYSYNLKTDQILELGDETTIKYPSSKFGDFKTQDITLEKFSSKSSYNDLSDYLNTYYYHEKVSTTNPTKIQIKQGSYLFEQPDGWYSFLATERFKGGSEYRTDHIMYYFKDEVSISKEN